MSTSHKHHQFHATSAEEFSSNSKQSSEKPLDYLLVLESQRTYLSRSLPAQNADMSTENSYQRKLRISMGNNFDGLHIYD